MSRFELPSLALVVVLLAAAAAAQEPADAPLPPNVAAERMTLPEGFRATLFAGEPDVVQPIAFAFDHRGRLWVVECLSYPDWDPEGAGEDRVVIFEDTDGDGRFDSKKVFLDDGGNLSGIAVGYGGVWLCSLPNFVFVPDSDGDDRPDGPARVLLDGWSLECKHNVFNGLTWGPDGWLYGLNGITATSYVGKPEAGDDDRVPMNCGVWRYHPWKHVFEVVATGTTNPWGIEFDDRGEIFITNCVIEHLFHVVPGGRYDRMRGEDLAPFTYELMPSIADYLHWGGGPWQSSRGGQGIHDAAGGGHAHVGCMIYRGDNWPAEYRGRVYTCNLHGSRVNVDSLHPHRSGYRSNREPDFLKANDTWFRGLEMKYGPDGGVYLTDWSDTGECHDEDFCDRTNGRIFKITYGDVKPWQGDLSKLSDLELVELFEHENEWFARRGQLALLERFAAGHPPSAEAVNRMRERLVKASSIAARQRMLSTLSATHPLGLADVALLARLLEDEEPAIRSWTLRNFAEHRLKDQPVDGDELAIRATNEEEASVRLTYASILQTLPLNARKPVALALLSRAEDADDPNIPLLLWYGIEPVAEADPAWALEAIRVTRIPLVRQFLARRVASLK